MTTTVMSLQQRLMRQEEPGWLVWLLVGTLLAIGLLTRAAVEGRTNPFDANGVALRYPAAWTAQEAEGALLLAADPFASGSVPPTLLVRQLPTGEMGRGLTGLDEVALAWSTRQGQALSSYRALRSEALTVDGQPAVLLEYAYVTAPEVAAVGSLPPVVARAEDILVQQGETLTVLTFAADNADWESVSPAWQRILATLDLK